MSTLQILPQPQDFGHMGNLVHLPVERNANDAT